MARPDSLRSVAEDSRPILLCYDGSEDAKRAISRAAELFPAAGALVLHVWEPLKDVASVPRLPGLHGMLEAGLAEMDEIGEEISGRLAAEGAELAGSAGLSAEALSVRGKGRAWRNILALARERDVSVIVLGQRGVSAAELAILGSVSNPVVHRADRPVLVVPNPGH